MAKSTYISSNLTEEQIVFLRLLDDNEILYFSLDDIESRIGSKPKKLNELVENLCQKKLFNRLERGKYAKAQFSDTYVLGSFIANSGVVAYWSALHLHGLTERFPNKLFIKTTARKRNTQLLGTAVQFVSVQPRKNIGIMQNGYGDLTYPLTDPEATLLDCFDQPRYAGDWPDLIRAFYQARLNAEKLIEYAKVYNNASIRRRMGYLAELFEKKELQSFIRFAEQNPGNKYVLFDAAGADSGAFNKRWMLRMNMEEAAILDCIQDTY